MGIFGSPSVAQPAPLPPPVPLPPAAHPPVLGSSATAQSGTNASRAGAAAYGMGFDSTIATSPQGLTAPATAKSTLLGQ